MKKVLAILLMVVLVAAMGVTAYATPSAEAQGVISGVTAVDGDDNEVNFAVEKSSQFFPDTLIYFFYYLTFSSFFTTF